MTLKKRSVFTVEKLQQRAIIVKTFSERLSAERRHKKYAAGYKWLK
jgi:uncharacterized small protein (DUF1192 family)